MQDPRWQEVEHLLMQAGKTLYELNKELDEYEKHLSSPLSICKNETPIAFIH